MDEENSRFLEVSDKWDKRCSLRLKIQEIVGAARNNFLKSNVRFSPPVREDAAHTRKIVITHASYHGATAKITRLHMYITFATRISNGTIPPRNSTFRSRGALLTPLAYRASCNNVCRAHFVNCLPALCTLIKLDTRCADKSNTGAWLPRDVRYAWHKWYTHGKRGEQRWACAFNARLKRAISAHAKNIPKFNFS